MSYPWMFTQLSGGQKTLTLSDRDAPLGRPRKGAVLKDHLKMVQAVTRVSGNRIPIRHIFTDSIEPFELSGRFRDRYGDGKPNYAIRKRDFIKGFYLDHAQCRIDWGSIHSVRGVITEVEFGVEAESEITYRIVVEVDDDLSLPAVRQIDAPPPSPKDFTNQIRKALGGNLFDQFDDLVSSVNSATASLLAIANQIDDFSKQGVGVIRRFRAGLNQARTAIVSLQQTLDTTTSDMVQQTEYAKDEMAYWKYQTLQSLNNMFALGLIEMADREAEIAERGKVKTLHTAKSGETWERISEVEYGGSDRAQDIIDANGIGGGLQPVAGCTYIIPV